MSRRNVIWLVVIVAAGVIVGLAVGVVWGLIAGGAVLLISEVVERSARRRRRAQRDALAGADGSR